MYQRHFGFKERPFRLVPDPAYLFMGRGHREAMAHLSYAVQSGDGFATVTGEVGTGKTTLCRAFLDQLPENVTFAYIFNPPADPVDLMRAVNRDFGLEASGERLQDLVEDLNRFLIEEKTEGRTALLVIDEAQRLSRQVLEQVRLLSNLETSRSKLLLIVLVGQPELERTLAEYSLRQLRQRITASCRLAPLTLAETAEYIRHRLAVATQEVPVVFTPAAIRVIFGFSKGIPRLINMACDRALITAYAAGVRDIDRRLARRAVGELKSDAPNGRLSLWPLPVVMAALVVALAALGFSLKANFFSFDKEVSVPVVQRHAIQGPTVATDPAESIEVVPAERWQMDRIEALATLLGLWGLSANVADTGAMEDDLSFFTAQCESLGLLLYPVNDRLGIVERLNLPAFLALTNGSYSVLAGVQGDSYLMAEGAGTYHPLTHAELEGLWTGTAFVPWRDFYEMGGTIAEEATGKTVLNLKMMLRDLGYPGIDLAPVFDDTTRQAIFDFQNRIGLPADGLVGPQTKIALYNTRPELNIPVLRPLAPVQRAALQEGGP
jgi:general secretion pathway protein A